MEGPAFWLAAVLAAALVGMAKGGLPVVPLAVGLVCLVGRGNLWEGRRGLFYAAQRVYAELLLLLLLLEPVS